MYILSGGEREYTVEDYDIRNPESFLNLLEDLGDGVRRGEIGFYV